MHFHTSSLIVNMLSHVNIMDVSCCHCSTFRVFSELIHHGKVLDDEKSLVDNGVKADEMIYVLRKNVRNPPEPRKKYTEIELYEFLLFFKTFEIPSETDLALLLQIRVRGFFFERV